MAAARQGVKSAAAFRTISEVSTDLEVPQHVLRFWESKFTPVRPLKRGGGRRYYRPEDVDLLRRIRNLLYTDGYTIKGVQRLLREGHGKLEAVTGSAGIAAASVGAPGGTSAAERATLKNVLTDLIEIRGLLPGAKKRKSKS